MVMEATKDCVTKVWYLFVKGERDGIMRKREME